MYQKGIKQNNAKKPPVRSAPYRFPGNNLAEAATDVYNRYVERFPYVDLALDTIECQQLEKWFNNKMGGGGAFYDTFQRLTKDYSRARGYKESGIRWDLHRITYQKVFRKIPVVWHGLKRPDEALGFDGVLDVNEAFVFQVLSSTKFDILDITKLEYSNHEWRALIKGVVAPVERVHSCHGVLLHNCKKILKWQERKDRLKG